MEIRSIIEMLLAIEQYRLSKRIRKLSRTVFYLSSKDEKEGIQYDKRRNIK